jgi:quercetin dioxygenase-like cupin family protein
MRTLRYTAVLFIALAAYSLRANAQGASGTEFKWGPAPAVFPAGARMAVLAGDPSKGDEFVVRLDLPDGYTIAPHWHPTDEHVTVVKGTFLVGMGDRIDPSKMITLPAGGFITAPAKMHHFARAKGRVIVQVNAMGPFQLTYVNSSDDPSKGIAKR